MESPTYEDFTRSYANKLSKDELIIYTNACVVLSTHPDFLEWANQFQSSQFKNSSSHSYR